MLPMLLVVLAIAFLVLLDNLACRALDRDDEVFAESIKHLPAERQAVMWAEKLRDDARRDLP